MTERNPLDTQPTHDDGPVDVEANTQDHNTEVEKSGTKRSDRTKAKA